MRLNLSDVWVIIVSIKHHPVSKLIRWARKLGVPRDQIVVVTNEEDANYERAGIFPEYILEKKDYGYVGAMTAATGKIIQYNAGAITINVSSEREGGISLRKAKKLISKAVSLIKGARAVVIGSTTEESGIAVWRCETIFTAMMGRKLTKTSFQDLVSGFEKDKKIEVLEMSKKKMA